MSRSRTARRFAAAATTVAALTGAAHASADNSVINLGGIGYVYGDESMSKALNGAYSGPGYTQYYINSKDQYPNQGDESGDAIAVQSAWNLINRLRADDPNGAIYYKGSSNGSIIGSRLIATMVANGESTQNIYMVLLVNPASGTNGYEARFPSNQNAFMTALLGGHTTKAVGGVKILSVQGQYDLISDAPVYWFNPLADVNAIMGFAFVHPFVYNMNLNDPRNYVTTSPDGNLTQVVVWTDKLPITMPLRVVVPGPIVDAIDRVLRPLIETAYIRPDASDPNNPANNPENVIKGSFAPDPSKWLGVLQRLVTGELQAFGLMPTPPHSTGTVQLPGPTSVPVSTAAVVPTSTVAPTTTTTPSEPTVAKSDVQVQSLALAPATATQPPASQPDKPVVDSKDKASDAPVSSPSVTPPAQPVVTNTTPPTGSPVAEPQQNSQKEPASDVHKDTPKDEKDAPKVKAPTSDHPKGETDSASDVMKNGNAVQSRNVKKGDNDDQGSGPKSGGVNSTAPHTTASNSSSTDSDSAGGSKASASASGGESHSTS